MKETLFHLTVIGLIFFAECQYTRPRRQGSVGAPCTTPDAEAGDCYNIRQCPRLLDLLRSSRNKPEVVDFLRRSVCGFDDSDPRVCCPNTASDQPFTTSTSRSVRLNNNDYDRNRNDIDGKNGNVKNEQDQFQNLPSPPNCGFSDISQTRIIGGTPAVLGAWPWMAALGYKGRGQSQIKYLCGGTLVTNKHIITAAHCTKHPSLALYVARLGDLDLDDNVRDNANPVDYIIRSALAHPGYDAKRRVNDIAILYLRETVEFTKFIRPICMPKMEKERSSNFTSTHPFVSGWGSVKYKGPSSTALLQVQLPIVPNDQCRTAYAKVGSDITPKELCAGPKTGGKDACLGDSGGPLMLPLKNYTYLIGVVSYGYNCGEPEFPGVYSRTTEYIDWINKNLG